MKKTIPNITLEMSLKPFHPMTQDVMTSVCEKFFGQWQPLLKDSIQISVLLWTADGSEILEYKGNMDDPIQWCSYIGGANPRRAWDKSIDPQGLGLHTRNYPYIENPPEVNYGILRQIVRVIKHVGASMFPQKTIRVGATFDPGPEFAKSDFKYRRHNEICLGESMGKSSMVCAYARLHADSASYAGFPCGIEEGTPFGTFFGKQCQCFLSDLGFDYIWFSNGLGFGTETWGTTGAIFDGSQFHVEKLDCALEKVLEFWRLFRQECPDYPIEVRGTNLSMGIDFSTDGVPLKNIYETVENLLPPPNSPWAALDGDFGLELIGYLTRIAEIPNGEYLFRYYIHDPWWANSPWYDRYGGQPHDIYLPLSTARIDENAMVHTPTHLNLLSIDNSFGQMPDSCVYEPLPHLLRAIKELPDAPAPVVLVYPFSQYNSSRDKVLIQEMFFCDWFLRGAINAGFPLSMIVSCENFILSRRKKPELYRQSVLLTPVPAAGSPYEKEIFLSLQEGHKVLFYGPIDNASDEFLKLIGLKRSQDSLEGELSLRVDEKSYKIKHNALLCAGGINSVPDDLPQRCILASVEDKVMALHKENFAWVRGSLSSDYVPTSRLLVPQDPSKYFTGESLLLKALAKLGYELVYQKPNPSCKTPVLTISRSNNGFYFSVFSPSTTVETQLYFPLGAPVLMGYETQLKNGRSTYHFPKAEHRECRVFVQQQSGIVGARELPPVSYQMRRRIEVNGLQNATVYFFPEEYCTNHVQAVLNSRLDYYFVGDPLSFSYVEDENGRYWKAENVTGALVLSMPRKTM